MNGTRFVGLMLLLPTCFVALIGTVTALLSKPNWMAAAIVAWVVVGLLLLAIFLTNVRIAFDWREES